MDDLFPEFKQIVTQSPPMLELFEQIRKVADIDIPILITGESGTGKELAARAIHNLSTRNNGPFIAVNTGAISPELVASELFGHEKGAFTGAVSQSSGKFEIARGGTLFLDEIGTMDTATQISLLRVIENKQFQSVGGEKIIQADVRIIAATNANIPDFIKKGSFREDLFHRLNVFPIHLPPLRERDGDIPLLLRYFSSKYCEEFSLKSSGFTKKAVSFLVNYTWPGNIRELENTVMRLLITKQKGRISEKNLPEEIIKAIETDEKNISLEIGTSLDDAEKIILQRTLKHMGRNKLRTAQTLGISRKALYNKLKKHSLL